VETAIVGATLLLVLLVSAFLLVRLAGPRCVPAVVLGTYVVAWAELIVIAEALSLVGSLNRAGLLISEAAVCGSVVAALCLRRSPSTKWPTRIPHIGGGRILVVLGAGVMVSSIYQAFLILTVPPNNVDSMIYHLTRAAYWHQQERVAYVANAPNEILNSYPVNGEIGILFSFVATGSDRLAAAPQFLASLVLVVAVYGIARRLRFDRDAAAFAGLIAATLPQVALQATTTQNDLVSAAFVAAAVYFLLGETRFDTVAAASAIGLGVGTKVVVLLALPFMLLVAAYCHRTRLRYFAVCVVPAVVLLGSYRYVENFVRVGNVLGNPAERVSLRPGGFPQPLVDAAHILFRFFELPGFADAPSFALGATIAAAAMVWFVLAGDRATGPHRIPPRVRGLMLALAPLWLVAPIGLLARSFFHPDWPTRDPHQVLFNTRSNEDIAFFGPVGAIFILPLVGYVVATQFRKRRFSVQSVLALALPAFLLAYAITLRYQPFAGRFFLIPIAVTAPLLAHLYRTRPYRIAAATIAVVTLVFVHIFNEAKPLRSNSQWVWSRDRAESQSLMQRGMARPLTRINETVPADAAIGVAVRSGDWVYPAFGRTLRRRVVFLPRQDALAAARRANLAWVLVAGIPADSRGWNVQPISDTGLMLARRIS